MNNINQKFKITKLRPKNFTSYISIKKYKIFDFTLQKPLSNPLSFYHFDNAGLDNLHARC